MIRFIPEETPDTIVYCAVDRDEELGYILVKLTPPLAEIAALQAGEDAICDGLARAALSYALNHGAAQFTVAPGCGCQDILARLAIIDITQSTRDIADIFSKNCGR